MSDEGIAIKTKHDWSRADDMSDDQVHAAALADPDAQPRTEERLAKMRLVPRAETLRRARGLTQEEFAARFHIPPGTLRDLEQGKADLINRRVPTFGQLPATRRRCSARLNQALDWVEPESRVWPL